MSSDPLAGCDDYRLIREAGRSGVLELLVAHDVAAGSEVLVKLLPPEAATDPQRLGRLRATAEAVAQLDHPNLDRPRAVRTTASGRPFIVTEPLAGRPLREEVERFGGSLPEPAAIDTARQALAGLGAAHTAGVVHGALTLDCLFVCQPAAGGALAGRRLIKVQDFGLAEVLDELPLAPGQDAGVPDPRADVFAVGLVLYALLTGRTAFAGGVPGDTSAAPPSLYAPSSSGPELDAVVLRSLERDPEDRFRSAAAFEHALAGVAAFLSQLSLPGNLLIPSEPEEEAEGAAAGLPPAAAPRPEERGGPPPKKTADALPTGARTAPRPRAGRGLIVLLAITIVIGLLMILLLTW